MVNPEWQAVRREQSGKDSVLNWTGMTYGFRTPFRAIIIPPLHPESILNDIL